MKRIPTPSTQIQTINFAATIITGILLLIFAATAITAQDAAEPPRQKTYEVSGDNPPEQKDDDSPTANLINAATYQFLADNSGSLEDMSSGTSLIFGPGNGSGGTGFFNIGFEFYFDGVRYTQFAAYTSGLVTLGTTFLNDSSNFNDLDRAGNVPKIAPYWDSLCVGSNGKVHYKTIGAAPNRLLIVEWRNIYTDNNTGCNAPGTGTFQMQLFESAGTNMPGAIQFVYGAIPTAAANQSGYSVGFQSGAATNFASVTTVTDTVSYTVANDNQTTAIPAGKIYTFTPSVPNAPTNLTFTNTTPVATTLNWTDNSSNELGFLIYRSTDGGATYTFRAQTAANTTSFRDTGLGANTTYFYRVYSFSEGAFSNPLLQGSVTTTTATAGNITSVASGNYSNPATWSNNAVPTANDRIVIANGHTVTIDGGDAFTLTVQSGGVLEFESVTARTLNVEQTVTINAGGTLRSNAAGTVTAHRLVVGSNLVNNGTLDFSTNGDTAGAEIRFTGEFSRNFNGTGAVTDLRLLTVDKGFGTAVIETSPTLEINLSNMTVRGAATGGTTGFLNPVNGIVKFSGTNTFSNTIFQTNNYTIPNTAGVWFNNPNFTTLAPAASSSPVVSGLFRLSQGAFNTGAVNTDQFRPTENSIIIIEGGAFNAAARFSTTSNMVTYRQTGGTVRAATVGNATSASASFGIGSGLFTMSAGTIILVQPSTGADKRDAEIFSSTSIAGGTLQIGDAATPAGAIFNLNGTTPSLVIDNSTAPRTAVVTSFLTIRGNLTVNSNTMFQMGRGTNNFPSVLVRGNTSFGGTAPGNVANNGAITYNDVSPFANFQLSNFSTNTPQMVSGSGTLFTAAAPVLRITIDNPSGVTFNQPVFTRDLSLFSGAVTGAANITLGAGGTTQTEVFIGGSGITGGSLDAAPNFNIGSGGYRLYYGSGGVATRTTGFEIPPSRTMSYLGIDNTNGLILAGGNLTVTGDLQLFNGTVSTGANTLIHNGTATRNNGFVNGNLQRSFTAAETYTYFVGQNGYSPVTATVTAGTFPSTLTVQAVDAALSDLNPATSISRHWLLTEGGNLTANLSFTYTDADVNGNEADYRVFRRNATNQIENRCPGAPCVNTAANTAGPVVGVTDFSLWSVGENAAPTAAAVRLGGRVRTADGRGIRGARIVLTQPDGSMRTAMTGAFGYYRFDDVPAGQSVVINVFSKRFTFGNSSQVVAVTEENDAIDFIAEP